VLAFRVTEVAKKKAVENGDVQINLECVRVPMNFCFHDRIKIFTIEVMFLIDQVVSSNESSSSK